MQMQTDASRCSQVQANAPDIRYSINDTRYSNIDNDKERVGEDDRFEDFWAVYPRKVSKQSAIKAWSGGKCSKIADTIISDVQKRIGTEWNVAEMQFIPHPTTYLHQRRWEDETPPQERIERGGKPVNNPALGYQQREYKDEDFDGLFINLDEYGRNEDVV
jgi:hypothetical protein